MCVVFNSKEVPINNEKNIPKSCLRFYIYLAALNSLHNNMYLFDNIVF